MEFKEEWRVIPDFELYEVSNMGRVRSSQFKTGKKIIRGTNNGLGYSKVQIMNEHIKKFEYIHRLVAKLFIPNPFNKPCVNHIDNNPGNNRVDNLEWCTKQENSDWMVSQGRNKRTTEWLNNLHQSQEVSYKPIIGRNLLTGDEIYFRNLNSVKKFGFQPSCVCNCCKGIRETHKGYEWRYA